MLLMITDNSKITQLRSIIIQPHRLSFWKYGETKFYGGICVTTRRNFSWHILHICIILHERVGPIRFLDIENEKLKRKRLGKITLKWQNSS